MRFSPGPEALEEACFLLEPGAGACRNSWGRGHEYLSYGRLRGVTEKDPMELWEAGPAGQWEPIRARSLARPLGFSSHVSSPWWPLHSDSAACLQQPRLESGEGRPRGRVQGPASGGER